MAAKWLLPAFFDRWKTICVSKVILDTVLICCDFLNPILRPKPKAKQVFTSFPITNNEHIYNSKSRIPSDSYFH